MSGFATDLDVSVLQDLDFDYAPPCESVWHDVGVKKVITKSGEVAYINGHDGEASATWRLEGTCPRCAVRLDYLVCNSKRLEVLRNLKPGGNTCFCNTCERSTPAAQWNYVLTPLTGGAG